jgi:putative ATPase
MPESLFDSPESSSLSKHAPLAARLRPESFEEVVGQDHLTGVDSPLKRMTHAAQVNNSVLTSIIFYGPPGTGKTTLAQVLANESDSWFSELSATSSGVKEVRAAIDLAKSRFARGRSSILFIDEIHRFSKTQQDTLLQAVEEGWITLVGATTENPSVSVNSALLSRAIILNVKSLNDEHLAHLVERAFIHPKGLNGYEISEDAKAHLIRFSAGDARKALVALEAASGIAQIRGSKKIEISDVSDAMQRSALRYDKSSSVHYDVASAFIKSVRGSDVDAALHYLARMIESGEDPKFIARRLIISASEDIGLADPKALVTATTAAQAVALVGWPEARIILSQAVIALALAPKSNSAYLAIDSALADVRDGMGQQVPDHLRDGSLPASRATGAGIGYQYAHDFPQGVAPQQYLPEDLKNRSYYQPKERGEESRLAELWERIKQVLR